MAMSSFNLVSDCDRCVALCCSGPPFEKSADFGLSKAAGVACDHLGAGHRCTIPDHLAERGFSGGVVYDCHGAGQRVTQQLFGGRSWRNTPEIATSMFEAFAIMRRLHSTLLLLETAAALELDDASEAQRSALVAQIDAAANGPLDAFFLCDVERFEADAHSFLQTLKALVPLNRKRAGGSGAE